MIKKVITKSARGHEIKYTITSQLTVMKEKNKKKIDKQKSIELILDQAREYLNKNEKRIRHETYTKDMYHKVLEEDRGGKIKLEILFLINPTEKYLWETGYFKNKTDVFDKKEYEEDDDDDDDDYYDDD